MHPKFLGFAKRHQYNSPSWGGRIKLQSLIISMVLLF